MVQRYGPINPLPELLFFLVFVLANVWIGRVQALDESARRQLWDIGLVFIFVLLVTVLCVRAVRRRAVARAFSTAAIFGFAAGSIIWGLYVATETVSEGLSLNYQVLVTEIWYGLACSAIAFMLSALEISVYWVIKGKAGR